MKFDRNTVIGFVVLAVLFLGYFFYTSKEQQAYQRLKAHQDSLAMAKQPRVDPVIARQDSLRADSFRLHSTAGQLDSFTKGSEQLTIVENDVFRIAFTNKGAQPKWVELKGFKAPDSGNVRLASSSADRISYAINTGSGSAQDTSFYFTGGQVAKNADGSQSISYQLQSPQGALTHQFVIKKDNYMLDFNIQVTGAGQLVSNNTLNLTWQNKANQLQKDLSYEKQQSFIAYRENGSYDDKNVFKSGPMEFSKPVNWIGVKQQFFNSTLIAKNNFSSGTVQWESPTSTDTSNKTIVQITANMKLPLSATGSAPMALYYGPTDYKIMKQYGNEMESMVNLGSGIFSFVKYINRWIILPVFDLFRKITTNFGIVILLLTLFIRLLISPLTYKSYLSGAKMKVLKPEIDKLKLKFGEDKQAISMEQMKLFREAGVNPLGGCIPAVFQIPIFFALYSFFNSNVALRGQSFLWANDLSQYDSFIKFGVSVPLLGDHLSLFTITAVVTSLLISIYSMSMTPTQDNPMMKYMPYFFPIILLFVFNKLPAALTWYYTVSNIITLTLQFVIQNYIINHDKILAKMDENRRKPKTKSKWQEKMEQMQEQQKRTKGK